MEIKEIKNKEGEVLTSKDGKPLLEYRLEAGDQFIPQYNSVLEKTREVEKNGKTIKISSYYIIAKVRQKDGSVLNNGENVFITLTPMQAKRLQKFSDDGILLNQNLFIAYKYENQFGDQIGIALKKDFTQQKDFSDFDFDNQPEDGDDIREDTKNIHT